MGKLVDKDKSVVDAAKCQHFSRHSSFTLALFARIILWPSIFLLASLRRALINEDGIMGLLSFSIWFIRGAYQSSWRRCFWYSGCFRNGIRSCEHQIREWGFWRHDRCSHWGSVKFVAFLCLYRQLSGKFIIVCYFHKSSWGSPNFRRSWWHIDGSSPLRDARGDENAPWSRDIFCHYQLVNQAQFNVGAVTRVKNCLSKRFTMVIIISNEDIPVFVPLSLHSSVNYVLDHLTVDRSTPLDICWWDCAVRFAQRSR